MPQVQYSPKAEADLAGILRYTLEQWGAAQTSRYLDRLVDTFDLLAHHPEMGRTYFVGRLNWRRFEIASHVILYRPIHDGIKLQRISHKRQLNP